MFRILGLIPFDAINPTIDSKGKVFFDAALQIVLAAVVKQSPRWIGLLRYVWWTYPLVYEGSVAGTTCIQAPIAAKVSWRYPIQFYC